MLGILLLNVYGKYVPRRRVIEGGLIGLGITLVVLGLVQRVGGPLLAGPVVSLLTVVVAVAFAAGVTYAFVAVPSQTQLQEELPVEVRGRVFGVLNMLVSVASFLPIIIVGPVADLVGTTAVMVVSGAVVGLVGAISILKARPSGQARARHRRLREPVDPMTVTTTAALTRPVRLRYVDGGPRAPSRWPRRLQSCRGVQDRHSLTSPRVGLWRAAARRRRLHRRHDLDAARSDDRRSRPSLDGAAILARIGGLDAIADVEPIDWGSCPRRTSRSTSSSTSRGRSRGRSRAMTSTGRSSSRART